MREKPPHPLVLSARELEIVKLIATGKINKQIAGELGIGVKTVETHRVNLMHKLKLRNMIEVAHYCLAHGLVENIFIGDEP